jgi:broad specificity phosphatase PhoE
LNWIVFLAGWAVAAHASADEKLWSALQAGGHVVLIRHAVTTPGSGDPPGFKLDDCTTQRNLTGEGRQHALLIKKEFEKRRIPVGRVLSSPWCRCLETARLAFGRVDGESMPLSNLFGRPENREKQVSELKKMVSVKPEKNLILVTHGSTIHALTGISPGTGEMVILARGKVVGRLLPP